ncbi:MAG TPA: TAT-variant-translocated molybdopterin oxidoreductase [Terriglobales bacterium]|nr:TAT-variant-translocated molybdopterin oxidoreductase [Terriglobales bacterium]
MEKESEHKPEAVCPSKLTPQQAQNPRSPGTPLELAEVRDKLSGAKSGPQYWRCLEELAQSDGFVEMLHREFPRQASIWPEGASRRDFLKLMSASMALAGLSACVKQPLQPIIPYVRQPNEVVLGNPLFFASAMPFGAYASPVLVESHEGRPTKIEGNPEHPASLGGSCVFSQASILDMYDPDRAQTISYLGGLNTWSDYTVALRNGLNVQKAVNGAGLRILSAPTSSPTMAWLMDQVQAAFPESRWIQWEPVNRDNANNGAKLAFGEFVETRYDFTKADVILSLDSDFLSSTYPGFVYYARQFAMRRVPDQSGKMSRFYSIQSTPTGTSGKADDRLPARASEIEAIARAIAARVGAGGGASGNLSQEQQKFVDAVVKDLQAHKDAAVVVPGEDQPPAVHALAHMINHALGATGNTVIYTDNVMVTPADQTAALKTLVGEMNDGKVDLLVIMGSNPVYGAPVDFGFADAMNKVPLRIQHGLYNDETTELVHWHINGTHYLEEWGDVRAFDGTASIIQPLIAPLYNGKSQYEFIFSLIGSSETAGYDLVRKYWQGKMAGGDFEAAWRKVLNDGFIPNTALPAKTVTPKGGNLPASPTVGANAMEVIFRPDPLIFDGSRANNAWLQETPKPVMNFCWVNGVLVSPNQAKKSGLETGDTIEIEVNGRKVRGPIWPQPGHPDNAVTVFLGYGRTKAGNVGRDVGFNAYNLRSSDAPSFAETTIKKVDSGYVFAHPQGFQYIDFPDLPPGKSDPLYARHIIRKATLEEFLSKPNFAHEDVEKPAWDDTLYYNYQYTELKWGMAIDMNKCVGCKTCIVACQAENNIPVVGKEQTERGRQMQWLRVDVYYEGGTENPNMYFQPVPCMQCENAPCEVVCPVGATVHSTEGLNDMVYNRCVGTRYCSNNCPYKVRRFNFLLWQDWGTPQFKMMRNPEVSIRSRGVMEKCTYCVQRIANGRIAAERENRRVRDGEVITACQQACPANAIYFGDLNDPKSQVSKIKQQQRNYNLLEDLNTRPRTSYLAVVVNRNPDIEQPELT